MTMPAHDRKSGPGTAGRNVERDAKICARRNSVPKVSFDDLGLKFGLSRETVRLIVRRHDRLVKRAERLAPLRAAFAKGA